MPLVLNYYFTRLTLNVAPKKHICAQKKNNWKCKLDRFPNPKALFVRFFSVHNCVSLKIGVNERLHLVLNDPLLCSSTQIFRTPFDVKRGYSINSTFFTDQWWSGLEFLFLKAYLIFCEYNFNTINLVTLNGKILRGWCNM